MIPFVTIADPCLAFIVQLSMYNKFSTVNAEKEVFRLNAPEIICKSRRMSEEVLIKAELFRTCIVGVGIYITDELLEVRDL